MNYYSISSSSNSYFINNRNYFFKTIYKMFDMFRIFNSKTFDQNLHIAVKLNENRQLVCMNEIEGRQGKK